MSRSLPQIVCAFDQLPANLPADRRYVSWRYEQRHDQITKVPLVPGQSQRRASVTAPATWGSFADARADVEQRRVHGLGLVLTGDITVVDLDACVDPGTGAVTPLATLVLGQLRSYSERSPSGTGLHILGRGSLPPGRRRIHGLEVYDNKRFITLTGAHVTGTPRELVEVTSVLSVLHPQLFPRQPQVSHLPTVPPLSRDDHAVIAAAMAARNGGKFRALWNGHIGPYPSASEADAALCACLAFWCARNPERVDGLFRQSALYRPSKWHSRRGDSTYGWRTVLFACAVTTSVYTPDSLADDVEVPNDTNALKLHSRVFKAVRLYHLYLCAVTKSSP